jgi:hypothetical protein
MFLDCKKTEKQNFINEKIGLFIEPYGFILKDRREGGFSKHFEWGFQRISVSFLNYLPDSIQLGSSIGIRINIVEDILQRFLKLENKYYKNSLTYGCSLNGLVQGEKKIILMSLIINNFILLLKESRK